jgi:hypothetical protein
LWKPYVPHRNDGILYTYVLYIEKNGMGVECSMCRFWWVNLRERDHWRDPDVDERIILRLIFRKSDVGVWTGLSWGKR